VPLAAMLESLSELRLAVMAPRSLRPADAGVIEDVMKMPMTRAGCPRPKSVIRVVYRINRGTPSTHTHGAKQRRRTDRKRKTGAKQEEEEVPTRTRKFTIEI
jgi:hypothetical protein